MSTPRPIIDVDGAYCSAINKKRQHTLRTKFHTPHSARRVVNAYRQLQLELIRNDLKCSKKEAKLHSEDPSPYEKTHVFFCL